MAVAAVPHGAVDHLHDRRARTLVDRRQAVVGLVGEIPRSEILDPVGRDVVPTVGSTTVGRVDPRVTHRVDPRVVEGRLAGRALGLILGVPVEFDGANQEAQSERRNGRAVEFADPGQALDVPRVDGVHPDFTGFGIHPGFLVSGSNGGTRTTFSVGRRTLFVVAGYGRRIVTCDEFAGRLVGPASRSEGAEGPHDATLGDIGRPGQRVRLFVDVLVRALRIERLLGDVLLWIAEIGVARELLGGGLVRRTIGRVDPQAALRVEDPDVATRVGVGDRGRIPIRAVRVVLWDSLTARFRTVDESRFEILGRLVDATVGIEPIRAAW